MSRRRRGHGRRRGRLVAPQADLGRVAQREAQHRGDRLRRPRRRRSGRRRRREHRRPVRRGRPPGRPGLHGPSPGRQVQRFPQDARRGRPPDRRRGGRHARPHPRPAGHDGHEDGQALLLREAAGPLGIRGPHDAANRPGEEAGHADGHADPRRPELSPRGRARPVGGDRADRGGPRVVQRELRRPGPAHRHAPGPAGTRLGPVAGAGPYRPYHPTYVPASWRRWWDFGTGALGDFGCHYMDLPFWASSCGIRPASRPRARRSTPKGRRPG